jgi:hypothetical protein
MLLGVVIVDYYYYIGRNEYASYIAVAISDPIEKTIPYCNRRHTWLWQNYHCIEIERSTS